MNQNRVKKVASENNKAGTEYISGNVVYKMSREHRVSDNWALVHAYDIAKENKAELSVVYTIHDEHWHCAYRTVKFMLDGLREVETNLNKLNINFKIIYSKTSTTEFIKYCEEKSIGLVVTDMSPMREQGAWRGKFAKDKRTQNTPVHIVDARNIVPVWVTSDKQEFAARTIRPKIYKKIDEYLDEYPKLKKYEFNDVKEFTVNDFDHILKHFKCERDIAEFTNKSWAGGEKSADKALDTFLDERFAKYDTDRNDANLRGQSDLSPHITFGHISRQRIMLETQKKYKVGLEHPFLEELVIRAELSDNFAYFNPSYDKLSGIADWAKKTMSKSNTDKREYIYTLAEFENSNTHDELWNAAQNEMRETGKMHGYMRMYWAKKILEWSESHEEAFRIALYLNDKYSLDGWCPNACVGVLWSLGGLHDRAWFPRPIFGHIRYMARSGCEKKFKVKEYIAKWSAYDIIKLIKS
jgi:deoxyribodipyrimidine photo-lyase